MSQYEHVSQHHKNVIIPIHPEYIHSMLQPTIIELNPAEAYIHASEHVHRKQVITELRTYAGASHIKTVLSQGHRVFKFLE